MTPSLTATTGSRRAVRLNGQLHRDRRSQQLYHTDSAPLHDRRPAGRHITNEPCDIRPIEVTDASAYDPILGLKAYRRSNPGIMPGMYSAVRS
jgi:hypothetical protein